ncbi:MAG TPA: histidine kinase [Terriglobia bacterium]|nr:histidine kinase [Terriglobia bacterium]
MGISLALRSAPIGAPLSLFEVRHRERVLCGARILLAICAILTLHFDPILAGRYTLTAHLLLFLYFGYSLAALFLVNTYRDCGPGFLLLVHAADILWPALIALYTGGPNSPFLILFAIPLVASAFRWGLQETLGTALASVIVFLMEGAFVTSTWGRPFNLLRGEFHFTVFALEIISVLLLGGVLGHLAEGEKKLRSEAFAIKEIVQKADPEADVNETIEDILSGILQLFGAGRAVLALRSSGTAKGLLWSVNTAAEGRGALHFNEMRADEMARYFFPMPGHSWYLQKAQRGERFQLLALDREGRSLEKVSCALPGELFSENSFRTMLATTFALGKEWSGRVFLFDLHKASRLAADLRFFRELVGEAAPAVHGVYLLQRSRSRARTSERAHVARDLHDGVIQSLIALEMRVDGLRRQAIGVSPDAAARLESVRGLLREEVVNLRDLMQQLQSDDVAPPNLGAYVSEILNKFRRETGIDATCALRDGTAQFSPRVSREVVKIVHEALTNVRKHSGATRVHVGLEPEDARWKLMIEDDGKGFEFSGRLSQADLDASCQGPRVIGERVRTIKGDLAIESRGGQGSRLEIRFSPKGYG